MQKICGYPSQIFCLYRFLVLNQAYINIDNINYIKACFILGLLFLQ